MLEVEEVIGKDAFRRFVELPFALYADEPRWAPPVIGYERARLDPRTNPQLGADTRYLIARRRGRVVGRVLDLGDGRFGCFDIADEAAGVALLGAVSPPGRGPVAVGEEIAGVVVSGYEAAGVTARQWHPRLYADALEAAGLKRVEQQPTWRLPATAGPASRPPGRAPTASAGAFGDPRLVFRDVAAVPDVAPALRGPRPRGAWRLARQARRREWDTCTVVRVEGDPGELIPALSSVAAGAGYRWVIAPWSPQPHDAETLHAVYGR